MQTSERELATLVFRTAARSGALLLVCAIASETSAQTPPPKKIEPEPLPPIFASPAAQPAPPRKTTTTATDSRASKRRALSPEMSAKLAGVVARLAPPPPSGDNSTPAGSAGPADATPSSDAVVLDPYVVEEDKLPLDERDMLTEAGRFDRVYKEYPGLKLGRFSLGNGALIRDISADQLMRERMKEMAELSQLAAPPAPPKTKPPKKK